MLPTMTAATATSASWANPHLHPWFRMPSLKRKDLSDGEDDEPKFYQARESLSPSPAPSPKRRRCDVLETGMSQLTLDMGDATPSAHWGASSPRSAGSNLAPTVSFPDTPITALYSQSSPLSPNAPYAPYVTQIPTCAATPVVLPGSVEEPTSPDSATEHSHALLDMSMKGLSWYEIEKDSMSLLSSPLSSNRTPAHPSSWRRPPTSHRSPHHTVVDASSASSGIVITDLEDSDTEQEGSDASPESPGAPAFTISSALLDRLPKPHELGPPTPDTHPSNALVLYRPVVPATAAEPRENDDSRSLERASGDAKGRLAIEEAPYVEELPMGDEVPMEDTRPFTPIVEADGEPEDEPMDIEML